MARHIVTGGAGFIGSHVAQALAARGDRVVVLDDLSSGKEENVRAIGPGVDFRRVDVASDPLDIHFQGVDTVFHLAAIPSVPRSVEDPMGTHRANVDGTVRVLQASEKAGARRWIGASSSAVSGDNPVLPKREDMPPEPVSPYGAHKAALEMYARAFWKTYALETVALRYFNVFGPRQDPNSPYTGVMARFVTALLEGRAPVVFGDGTQSRDFVAVDDVVEANLRASSAEGVPGEVFNIAGGRARSVNGLLDAIQKAMGTAVGPVHEPPRPGDILHSRADITRAGAILDWEPKESFADALDRTVAWYQRLRATTTRGNP
jgi:UDP-glucose 4-epimerase